MVFERKIKIKGKEYWVLVHSIRNKDKIIQKTKYIGKTLPPKKELIKMKEEFLREINSKKYKYFNEEDLEKIEKKRLRYQNELKKLSSLEKKEKLNEFMIRYTYDSSKLSGVDITLRQTFLILQKGIIPKGFKNLKTAKEIENHEKGIVAITKYKGLLNLDFIKKLHKILLLGVDDSIAGKLRNELKRNVKIAGTPYVPPKWDILEKEIINFFKWYKTENRKLHALELASLVHLKIISMQPFVDGNSRLSRLLMNWILWKKNYPMVDIPVKDIENYYNALDKYQIEKKERSFINYLKKKFLSG